LEGSAKGHGQFSIQIVGDVNTENDNKASVVELDFVMSFKIK